MRKDELKHIIHGSFRKLDYLDVQNAGDISVLAVVKDKGGELEEQRVINDEHAFVNLNNFSVVFVANGLQINQGSFVACQSIRMLIIGNGCTTDMPSMELVNMLNLERVEIGSNCFNSVTALRVENCPKLRRLFIGDGSFKIIGECVIENNEELLELQLGGNKGVSVERDEKKSSETTSSSEEVKEDENNGSEKKSSKTTAPSNEKDNEGSEKNPSEATTPEETENEDKKDSDEKTTPSNTKKGAKKQRILRLASWYYSYTVMNRPSRVEESTAWR